MVKVAVLNEQHVIWGVPEIYSYNQSFYLNINQ